MADVKTEVKTAKFQVVAAKFWHSAECRQYKAGDVIELPADTKPSDSVKPYSEPKGKQAKGGEESA
jgi:hypothetical protein